MLSITLLAIWVIGLMSLQGSLEAARLPALFSATSTVQWLLVLSLMQNCFMLVSIVEWLTQKIAEC